MEYYIDKKHRIHNYGKIMFQHVQSIIKSNNVKKIMLTPNIESEIFWEKMGFYESKKIDPTNELPIYLKET
jgi:hypothetical protein